MSSKRARATEKPCLEKQNKTKQNKTKQNRRRMRVREYKGLGDMLDGRGRTCTIKII
jgi:DNA gyrase/topoisomerase IV subunit B